MKKRYYIYVIDKSGKIKYDRTVTNQKRANAVVESITKDLFNYPDLDDVFWTNRIIKSAFISIE